MVNYFCAKCGGYLNLNFYNKINQFLCPKCYYKYNKILNIKENYKIYICKECNTFYFNRYSENMIYFSNNFNLIENIREIIYNYILKPINMEEVIYNIDFDLNSLQKSNNNFVFINIVAKLNTWGITEEKRIKIDFKQILCINCANKKGNRFECIIQLRIKRIRNLELTFILNEIKNIVEFLNSKNPEFFISEIKNNPNGYDIFLSKKALLRKIKTIIEEKYPIIIKLSKKLMGKDPNTGGNLYRPYLLLKYIPIKEGDIFQKNNQKYKIKKIHKKFIYISKIDQESYIPKKLEFFESKNIKFLTK